MRWLRTSIVGLLAVTGWLVMTPPPAHAQLIGIWAWRNLAAPQFGGPWIAPDIRFRPLGILDGDPIWRSPDGRPIVVNNPSWIHQSQIVVIVPDDGAQVWVQGQLMEGTGRQRVFLAPSLEPGLNYVYEIRVRSGNDQALDETRTIPIRLGQQAIADFTRPAVKLMPMVQ